jgi:hypothetical protein
MTEAKRVAAAIAWIAIAGTMLAGCGSKKEETADAPAPAGEAPSEEGAPPVLTRKVCELKMTAPIEKEWVMYWDQDKVNAGGGNDSFGRSVHWANDQERESLKNNPEALSIACRQEEEPVLMIALNAFGSTEKDIPAGPGTYPIVPRKDDGSVTPGTFIAGGLIYENGMFEATGGTLKIDKLDTTGVAGSFSVEGKEIPVYGNRELKVEGRFDIPCIGSTLESLCTAPERRKY